MTLTRGSNYSESTPIVLQEATAEYVLDRKYRNGHRTEVCNKGFVDTKDNHENPPSTNGTINAHIQTEKGNPSESEQHLKLLTMSSRKKRVLFICVISNFFTAVTYSILGSFFPSVNRRKGQDSTMTGLVFGLYQLVVFLTSPLFGRIVSRIGAKFMFISGLFMGGCSTMIFGVLGRVSGGTVFLVLSLLVRFVEAFGFASFMAASSTIVYTEFKEYSWPVWVLLKVVVGCGNMLGPLVGGVLYGAGGFGLPFYCTASPILIHLLIVYIVLPSFPLHNENSENACFSLSPKTTTNRFHLMRSPLVVMPMITVFLGMCCMHFLFTYVSTLLGPFHLTPSAVGAMFTIGPIFYTSAVPVLERVGDVIDKQSALIIGGHFLSCIGWWVLAHSPLLPFVQFSLWTAGIGFGILGATSACFFVPTFKCMLYRARELELDCEKGPDTFVLVLGLYNSVFALGGFLGPLVGGIVVKTYGHVWVFTGIGVINLLMACITVAFFSLRYYRKQKKLKEEGGVLIKH